MMQFNLTCILAFAAATLGSAYRHIPRDWIENHLELLGRDIHGSDDAEHLWTRGYVDRLLDSEQTLQARDDSGNEQPTMIFARETAMSWLQRRTTQEDDLRRLALEKARIEDATRRANALGRTHLLLSLQRDEARLNALLPSDKYRSQLLTGLSGPTSNPEGSHASGGTGHQGTNPKSGSIGKKSSSQ